MACGVLVIEDDADVRQMMAEILTMEGFSPVMATNGREALDVLRAGPRPHVILLDLMMPVMDGWQFLRVQQADPELAGIPVVVITAAPGDRTRELDAVLVLRKPIDLDEALLAIRQFC